MSNLTGVLYVVATPIGNLGDISLRALDTLRTVDLVAAEDTRQTGLLLRHYGIRVPLLAYHEHNEAELAPRLAQDIAQGRRVALVSDAGTPLISDPGFRLVREARRQGLPVVPLPGASALLCALAASGLPTDRFLFAGFPPRAASRRRDWLQALAEEPGTLVFYEASHRIQDTLRDLCDLFGAGRQAVLARELTKLHETFLEGDPCQLAARLVADPDQRRGEHVLLVQGAGERRDEDRDPQAERILRVLLEELPVSQAVALTARIQGGGKNRLYPLAMALTGQKP